jgi:toxoflavin biosynthesis protein ToxD
MNEAVRVVHGEINHLSNRAAMGLPESYTSPNCEQPSWALQTYTGRSARDLAAVIENPARPLEERVGCASLVTLQGDPRINVFDPPMVCVPGGNAMLGLDEQRVDSLFRKYEKYGVHRKWIEKECPRFTLEIASFRLGKYPVTNLEYRAFLKDSPQEGGIPTSWPDGRMPLFRDNYPVYTVTPEDADAYGAWLARKTCRRFRLPTEYEWEYAAAGPEGRDFPW